MEWKIAVLCKETESAFFLGRLAASYEKREIRGGGERGRERERERIVMRRKSTMGRNRLHINSRPIPFSS
jgi:hypothetical protein